MTLALSLWHAAVPWLTWGPLALAVAWAVDTITSGR